MALVMGCSWIWRLILGIERVIGVVLGWLIWCGLYDDDAPVRSTASELGASYLRNEHAAMRTTFSTLSAALPENKRSPPCSAQDSHIAKHQ